MKISLDLTPGDFVDRCSIACIKYARLGTTQSLVTIQKLDASFIKAFTTDDIQNIKVLKETLDTVNVALWDAENKVRAFEKADAFGPEFVEVARSSYQLNDQRSWLKRQIDMMFGEPSEEKVYR